MGKHDNEVIAHTLLGEQLPGYLTRDGELTPEAKELISKLLAFGAVSSEKALPWCVFVSSVTHALGSYEKAARMSGLIRIVTIGDGGFVYLNTDNRIVQKEIESRINGKVSQLGGSASIGGS